MGKAIRQNRKQGTVLEGGDRVEAVDELGSQYQVYSS